MIKTHLPGRMGGRILPNYKDPPERRSFKLIMLLILGMFLLMLMIGLLAFWISVHGSEVVLIPDVESKELISALVKLQEKELYPKIQVRYSSDYDKGVIIEQKPSAGSIVKAGRRITLVVSKGPIIDRVENYVGQNLEEVRIHLQTLFASYRALLKIKEPVIYKYDPASSGIILAQKPQAGSVIDGVTNLEFVVSLGPRGEMIKVADFKGRYFLDAIAEFSSFNLPFVFNVRKASADEEKGVIVSQSPEPDSEVPYGSVIQLVMTRPENLPPGKVFGLFEYVLPDYPIMVDVSLDSISPVNTSTLLYMKHPGGPISIPYLVEQNSELVLYIFNKEEMRQQAELGGS